MEPKIIEKYQLILTGYSIFAGVEAEGIGEGWSPENRVAKKVNTYFFLSKMGYKRHIKKIRGKVKRGINCLRDTKLN